MESGLFIHHAVPHSLGLNLGLCPHDAWWKEGACLWEQGSFGWAQRCKVNKQLPASLGWGWVPFFFFYYSLEKLCGELQSKENKYKLENQLMWQNCQMMTELPWNLWRPLGLQSQPVFIRHSKLGLPQLSSHCVWGYGFYWGIVAAFGAYNSPCNTWELLWIGPQWGL